MSGHKVKPEINVTPLVDVVLVLLIIFMVITPQIEAGANIEVPGIVNTDKENKTKLEPITISVAANGELYLEKDQMSKEALQEKLSEMHAEDLRRKAVIKGDRNVRYAVVRDIFKMCQEIGFSGVSMQVGDKRKEGGRE